MDADDLPEDEGPLLPWISPDDRLWRHPSEMGASAARGGAAPPRPSRPSGVRMWSVAVVAGVVGAVLASGVGVATGSFEHRTTVLAPVTKMVSPADMPFTTAAATSGAVAAPNWPGIADAIAPSIVSITSNGPDGEQTGSGVLYTAAGDRSYILTASDLVDGGSIKVIFDDSESQSAEVVGIDPATGLGLVSVPGSKRDFPSFAQETSLQLAQPVLGIGAHNVGGDGPEVATGSISALDVAINSGDDATIENLIDITSSNPVTDLGSAMVNGQGAVFGVETSVDTPGGTDDGQTYVLPYDVADHVASQILAGVPVTHPWIGTVDSKDPSSATMSQLSLAGGSQITEVPPGSPAQRAGIQPSDIITAFDGKTVGSTGALSALLSSCTPGQMATISYIHQGQPRTTNLLIANAPSDVDLESAAGG